MKMSGPSIHFIEITSGGSWYFAYFQLFLLQWLSILDANIIYKP